MRMSRITILICQTLLISENLLKQLHLFLLFEELLGIYEHLWRSPGFFLTKVVKVLSRRHFGIVNSASRQRLRASRGMKDMILMILGFVVKAKHIEVKHFWNSIFSIVKNFFFEVGIRFYSFGPLGSFGQQPQATWADDDMFSHRLHTSTKLIDVSHTWCFLHCFNNFTRDWLSVVCLCVSTYI